MIVRNSRWRVTRRYYSAQSRTFRSYLFALARSNPSRMAVGILFCAHPCTQIVRYLIEREKGWDQRDRQLTHERWKEKVDNEQQTRIYTRGCERSTISVLLVSRNSGGIIGMESFPNGRSRLPNRGGVARVMKSVTTGSLRCASRKTRGQ